MQQFILVQEFRNYMLCFHRKFRNRLNYLLRHIAAELGSSQSQKSIFMISTKFLLEASKRPTYAASWHSRLINRYEKICFFSPGSFLNLLIFDWVFGDKFHCGLKRLSFFILLILAQIYAFGTLVTHSF